MWFHIIIVTTKKKFKALALLHQVPLGWHNFNISMIFAEFWEKLHIFGHLLYYELGYEQVAPWTPPMDSISLACMPCMLYIGCNRAYFAYNGCNKAYFTYKTSHRAYFFYKIHQGTAMSLVEYSLCPGLLLWIPCSHITCLYRPHMLYIGPILPINAVIGSVSPYFWIFALL